MDANPILEAFGNAKTVRNNNSSRFGKFTELHFKVSSEKVAELSGASIETYLLEKSRLVSQQKTERSFHIFYQLLAGKPAGVAFSKANAGDYSYLSRGGCVAIDGVDDSNEFSDMSRALTGLGVDSSEQTAIWSVLLSLLELGDITFEKTSKPDDAARLDAPGLAALGRAAAMLGLSADAVQAAMLNRVMAVGGGERITIALKTAEAGEARDSLAKYIYGELFNWLVTRVNASVPGTGADKFIGILDISGFEIFDANSFEQFCINFANEKIQQYFDLQILQQEQEIYELEGLRYRKVEYKDNQPLIDLVESKRVGVFALLDEACLVPRSSDATFSVNVHGAHSSNQYLSKPKVGKAVKKRLMDSEAFVINHFAGEVVYETKHFLAKNNDTIHDELINILADSSTKFVSSLFAKEVDEDTTYGPSGGRFKSVSKQFNTQLQSLMAKLNVTTSHFIRCIKPNAEQKPRKFDPNSVMTQLRYSGMCAALQLMQAGFPTRISFLELKSLYSPKMPAMLARLNPITFCEALLVALDLNGGSDFQMGLTKVFFRPGKLALLDQLTSATPENVDAIVRKVRKWLARKRFLQAAQAVRSTHRLMKAIEGMRAFRRIRKAANVMVRIVRVFKPMVVRIRRKLYSDEVLAKRRAEEEARKKKEEEEKARKEAEEEARRKAEEERLRLAEEERRRKIAEEKQRQEEERRALEATVAALQSETAQLAAQAEQERATSADKAEADRQALAALQTRLESERAAAEERIAALTAAAEGDKGALMTDMQRVVAEKTAAEVMIGDLTESSRAKASELEALTARYSDQQAALQAAEGKAAGLEANLAATTATLATRDAELEEKGKENLELTSVVENMTALASRLKTQLDESERTGDGLAEMLRNEQHAREDDTQLHSNKLAELAAAAADLAAVNEAKIGGLKSDKVALEARIEKAETRNKEHERREAALEQQLAEGDDARKELDATLADTSKKLGGVAAKKESLETEKVAIIQFYYPLCAVIFYFCVAPSSCCIGLTVDGFHRQMH